MISVAQKDLGSSYFSLATCSRCLLFCHKPINTFVWFCMLWWVCLNRKCMWINKFRNSELGKPSIWDYCQSEKMQGSSFYIIRPAIWLVRDFLISFIRWLKMKTCSPSITIIFIFIAEKVYPSSFLYCLKLQIIQHVAISCRSSLLFSEHPLFLTFGF